VFVLVNAAPPVVGGRAVHQTLTIRHQLSRPEPEMNVFADASAYGNLGVGAWAYRRRQEAGRVAFPTNSASAGPSRDSKRRYRKVADRPARPTGCRKNGAPAPAPVRPRPLVRADTVPAGTAELIAC
jgi:hypothetical protein